VHYDWADMWSDARWKQDIEPLDVGLDFVRGISPKKYKMANAETPRVHYGITTQEIEKVIEDLGLENTSIISWPDYHEMSEEEREEAKRAYDPSQITWILLNAVKELDAKVQELEAKLN